MSALFVLLKVVSYSWFRYFCFFFFSSLDFAIRSFIFSCFSFHSFLPVCTLNFIMLCFNFIMLFLVPFWWCCSFLSKLLFLPFSILLLFVPVQSYYLFLFNVTKILLFFFSLFFSTLHFQLHSALFQLHNALSCSFLALLFIPLQTTLLLLFVPYSILVVVHSCAELLFVPLQCCYNSLLFSTISCPHSTILLLTTILFTLFQVCVVVPSSYVALLLLQHCCSLLSTYSFLSFFLV